MGKKRRNQKNINHYNRAKRRAKLQQIYQKILSSQVQNQPHPLIPFFEEANKAKHPVLSQPQPLFQAYKINTDKKKKPIDGYLEAVSQMYRKKDLDILINPLKEWSTFQNWSPREIAIFESGFQKFGKNFEFLSTMIETKSPKEVVDFYLDWKNSFHYKSFRISENKRNCAEWI